MSEPPGSVRTTRERLIESIDERRDGEKGDQKVKREEERKLPAFHVQIGGLGHKRVRDVPRDVRDGRAPEKEREDDKARDAHAPKTDAFFELFRPRRELPRDDPGVEPRVHGGCEEAPERERHVRRAVGKVHAPGVGRDGGE